MNRYPRNAVVSTVAFVICAAFFMHSATQAQDAEQSAPSATGQKMGPVGEEEAKPLSAPPPVASVVDPGIIPSRQAIEIGRAHD